MEKAKGVALLAAVGIASSATTKVLLKHNHEIVNKEEFRRLVDRDQRLMMVEKHEEAGRYKAAMEGKNE